MPREQLRELLADEWRKLSPTDRSAFGDVDNYAAYRRAATNG